MGCLPALCARVGAWPLHVWDNLKLREKVAYDYINSTDFHFSSVQPNDEEVEEVKVKKAKKAKKVEEVKLYEMPRPLLDRRGGIAKQ